MNPLSERITLDFRASEPLYLQIARQVEQLLIRGDLKVGDQLPTVRELATELRINFNTVARAYRVLDEARIISTQRGRGTYIWEQPNEETMQALRLQSLEELTKKYLYEIRRLGVSPDEAIEKLKELNRSGEVIQLEEQNEINQQ